jgi:hypothetical protein
LAKGATATITMIVIPTVAGNLTNTAGVTSRVADPIIPNNRAKVLTIVN